MATITSAQSGNWTSTSTWVGGVVPTAADDVVIGEHTITINSVVVVADIGTIMGGSKLILINGDLSVPSPGNSNIFDVQVEVGDGTNASSSVIHADITNTGCYGAALHVRRYATCDCTGNIYGDTAVLVEGTITNFVGDITTYGQYAAYIGYDGIGEYGGTIVNFVGNSSGLVQLVGGSTIGTWTGDIDGRSAAYPGLKMLHASDSIGEIVGNIYGLAGNGIETLADGAHIDEWTGEGKGDEYAAMSYAILTAPAIGIWNTTTEQARKNIELMGTSPTGEASGYGVRAGTAGVPLLGVVNIIDGLSSTHLKFNGGSPVVPVSGRTYDIPAAANVRTGKVTSTAADNVAGTLDVYLPAGDSVTLTHGVALRM